VAPIFVLLAVIPSTEPIFLDCCALSRTVLLQFRPVVLLTSRQVNRNGFLWRFADRFPSFANHSPTHRSSVSLFWIDFDHRELLSIILDSWRLLGLVNDPDVTKLHPAKAPQLKRLVKPLLRICWAPGKRRSLAAR
jgi:hypothetical protein